MSPLAFGSKCLTCEGSDLPCRCLPEGFEKCLKERHAPLTSPLFVFIFTRRLADLLPTSNPHEAGYMNVTFLWKLKRSSMNKNKKGMAPQGQATKD